MEHLTSILRNEFVQDAKATFQINDKDASDYFDFILLEETGSTGFPGYMKLRAKEGDEFTHYTMFNGATVGELHFTLKSEWAWIYWLSEYLIITLGLIITGYYAGLQPFNISSGDWYSLFPSELGVTSTENKEKVLSSLAENRFDEWAKLLVPEGDIPHPVIEVYEQHSKNNQGDVLLSIKETIATNGEVKKRKLLGQWEISREEFTAFTADIRSS